MTPEKYAELQRQIKVMQHYAAGGKVEFRLRAFADNAGWTVVRSDGIDWDWERIDYRIVPIKKFIGVRLYRDAAGRVAAATDEEKMLIDAIEQEKHRWLSDWQALQITTPDN